MMFVNSIKLIFSIYLQKNDLEYNMNQDQRQHFIQTILQDTFFRLSLREELQILVQNTVQKPSLATAAIPILLQEIMDHITLVINFRIKEILNQDYSVLVADFIKLRGQLEKIKQKMIQFQMQQEHKNKTTQNKSVLSKNAPKSSADILKTKSSVSIESNSPMQFAKIKQQIQNIKMSLTKASDKNILQFISQTTQQISNRFDTKIQQICHSIQQISMRNTSMLNEHSMQFMDNKYDSIDSKVNGLTERIDTFETTMSDRYESNFKNVWNVVTDMSTTVINLKKQNGKDKGKENQEKRGITSFLNW